MNLLVLLFTSLSIKLCILKFYQYLHSRFLRKGMLSFKCLLCPSGPSPSNSIPVDSVRVALFPSGIGMSGPRVYSFIFGFFISFGPSTRVTRTEQLWPRYSHQVTQTKLLRPCYLELECTTVGKMNIVLKEASQTFAAQLY